MAAAATQWVRHPTGRPQLFPNSNLDAFKYSFQEILAAKLILFFVVFWYFVDPPHNFRQLWRAMKQKFVLAANARFHADA